MTIFERFKKIKAFVFDVDGVLTDGRVLVTEEGQQLRQFNVRDGFALKRAVAQGYPVAIITAGRSESVRKRLESLDIPSIYIGIDNKPEILVQWLDDNQLDSDSVLYMGDDLPDLTCMGMVGLPSCPADAVEEIKRAVHYISPKKGGYGAARDVIEKIMKLQGTWADSY